MLVTNKRELRERMSRIDFRMPGYSVDIDGYDDYWDRQKDYAHIFVTVRTRDTYKPDDPELIEVRHMYSVPLPIPEEQVIRYVREAIRVAVLHEADEWLREDGVIVNNPHDVK